MPAGTPGLHRRARLRKLGWHASDTHGLTFDGCRVPEDNLLGARGRGFPQFLAILDDGRIAISALAVGLAQACLDACRRLRQDPAGVRPADRRRTRGSPSRSPTSPSRSRRPGCSPTRRPGCGTSTRPGGGRAEVKQAAAIAKLYSSTAAVDATRIATQVFGGNGFMEEYPVARFYRDAKVLEIGEGTSEVQRLVIARGLGLPVP